MMTNRKIMVKALHETRFLQAIRHADRHVGIEVPDFPFIRDRHVAGIGLSVHKHDAIFAEHAVGAGIVHKAGDEKLLFIARRQIMA